MGDVRFTALATRAKAPTATALFLCAATMRADGTPRVSLGFRGLDEALRGGIPPRTLLLVDGPPGSGKTAP